MKVAGVVLAGGSGSRVRRDINKVYLPILDRPMLEYSVTTMASSCLVDRLVVVVRGQDTDVAVDLIEGIDSAIEVVTGGQSRTESEHRALEHLAPAVESGDIDLIAIHDGARPFLTNDLLKRVIEAAATHGGAIPGLQISEPLYRIRGTTAEHLPQESLRRVQTPQVFRARQLADAYQQALQNGVGAADTAEIVERFADLEVVVVPGDTRNIKVTFVEDFFQAEEFAQVWKSGCWIDQ